ncbi:YacL family protein [Aggregatibacter actinomycetemcomitans]|uniref:YacL family protein n=1 Tax=Aggregatibacter actinomycetemcomitans TaxID=714 RepID=UPI00023FF212|nr:YacL family protein [Aggregatibacter actinomycetemcomitans]EHK89980.1 hypothetical protein RHAA1_08888 [Aggregatibacter actinomycetemcomitans RhAA1]KNE77066.1 hypothetical protein RHAA2_09085 [Aggregatibacter actinomycetemcomitans RhAA1]
MNFQFTAYQGNIIAKRSMEHSAFANRFNIEVRLDPQLISTALSYLENPPAHRSSGGIGELEEIGFIITPQSLPFAALKILPVFCTLT